MLQFPICYHSHLNVSQITKTNRFQGRSLSQTPCQVLVQALFYPINVIPQISTKGCSIVQLAKHEKASKIAWYHLVSHCVISTPLDVQLVQDAPKGASYYPKNNKLQFYIRCKYEVQLLQLYFKLHYKYELYTSSIYTFGDILISKVCDTENNLNLYICFKYTLSPSRIQ